MPIPATVVADVELIAVIALVYMPAHGEIEGDPVEVRLSRRTGAETGATSFAGSQFVRAIGLAVSQGPLNLPCLG
jgi:hypothetical protein